MKRFAVLLFLGLTACASDAASEPQQARLPSLCNDYGEMAKLLLERHKETPRLFALSADGNLMVLLASEEGSWSMVSVNPSNIACMISVGNGWDLLSPLQGDPS